MPSPKVKILVVEDEAPVALNLQDRLESLGYDVPAIAVSGAEAVELASRLEPDVVVMDIRLQQGMDGIEAAERIRTRCHLPVIYLTAFADASTVARARRTEPFGYLLKPFRDRELQTCIDMALYKHKAEEQLRASERRYATTLQGIGDGLIAVDDRGCVTLMNRVAEALTGWSQADAAGRPIALVFRIVNEQTRLPLNCPVNRALQEGKLFELAEGALLVARDGRCIPVDDCVAPIQDENGEVTGAVLVFRDVSEKRRAEEALRQKAREIEDLYNHAPCGYHSLDADGTVVRINDTELRWLGRKREDVVGRRKFLDFLTPEGRRRFLQTFPLLKEGGLVRDLEYELVRPDGTTFPVLLSETAVTDGQGGFLMSRSTLYDLSERKRADEERRRFEVRMQQAQKLESLGVMASGIAHDFNNLLTSVLGYADLALMDLPVETPVRDYIEQAAHGARRAAELTRQMLAYTGRAKRSIELIDLSELVRDMGELLRVSISKKGTLSSELTDKLPLVQADATQVRQVVMNLILNAAEALGEQGGTITVRTGTRYLELPFFTSCYLADDMPEGDYVFLEVSDTGCGMTADTVGRIFDPFFTTKFLGRGLGLAAVLGIVRVHQGAIRVTSGVGRGTTFTVVFPVAAPASTDAGAVVRPAPAWRGSGTVLVVDDEPMVRVAAQYLLEKLGFTVLTAADGHEAVQVFRANANAIRLVLLDLQMPGMDGVETLRQLRRQRADLPVILCSGYGESHTAERLGGEQTAGIVAKPYHLEHLRQILEQVLGSSEKDKVTR